MRSCHKPVFFSRRVRARRRHLLQSACSQGMWLGCGQAAIPPLRPSEKRRDSGRNDTPTSGGDGGLAVRTQEDFLYGGRHEAGEKDRESQERTKAAVGVERRVIVDGRRTKEAEPHENRRPDVPTGPMLEESEREKKEGEKQRNVTMGARAEGTKNVAAIELTRRQEIERSGEEPDPSGAAYGMEEETSGVDAGMKDCCKEAQDERNAKNDVGVSGVRKSGNNFGVKNSIQECGNGENEADERARCADIEEGARGPDWGADENERSKSANQRGSWNEERVAGANVVMAASEKMAELMCQEDRHERQGEREAAQEASRMAIEERKGANKLIDRDGLIVRIGGGKLRAGGEASAQREKK
jgi:hypothetical protein